MFDVVARDAAREVRTAVHKRATIGRERSEGKASKRVNAEQNL